MPHTTAGGVSEDAVKSVGQIFTSCLLHNKTCTTEAIKTVGRKKAKRKTVPIQSHTHTHTHTKKKKPSRHKEAQKTDTKRPPLTPTYPLTHTPKRERERERGKDEEDEEEYTTNTHTQLEDRQPERQRKNKQTCAPSKMQHPCRHLTGKVTKNTEEQMGKGKDQTETGGMRKEDRKDQKYTENMDNMKETNGECPDLMSSMTDRLSSTRVRSLVTRRRPV